MSTSNILIEEARHAAGSGVPLRRALAMVGCFYLLATLLNATGIERKVQRLAFGPTRTRCLMVVSPVADAVRALRLDRPRRWLEQFNLLEE